MKTKQKLVCGLIGMTLLASTASFADNNDASVNQQKPVVGQSSKSSALPAQSMKKKKKKSKKKASPESNSSAPKSAPKS